MEDAVNPEQYGVSFTLVFHWQQWFTLLAWLVTMMSVPLRTGRWNKIAFAIGCALSFYVLASGGWYTGGMQP